MKDLIQVHFDELLLVFVLIGAGCLYLFRPETKDLLLAPVAGALLMALRGKVSGNGAAKILILGLICFGLAASPALAQTPDQPKAMTDLVFIGGNWAQSASPQTNPLFGYSHKITEGTYSFNLFDVLVVETKPIRTETLMTTGIAQHLRDFGPVRVYVLGTIGIASGAVPTGLAWSSGGIAIIPLGSGWWLGPNFRAVSSPAVDGKTRDLISSIGIVFGWGK